VVGSVPSARFSATVIDGTVLSSWWIVAIPSRRASTGEEISTSSPSSTMRPASRASVPARIFINVDLPAPFSPVSAWTSPLRRSKRTSSRARVGPKRLLIASSSSSEATSLTIPCTCRGRRA
jgi:hypothetical protein